jgi:hypothetical protein
LGAALCGVAALIHHLTNITTNFYDVYISLPLRIEAWIANARVDKSSARPTEFVGSDETGEQRRSLA